MCLAIPMKIKQINGEFAQVQAGRLTRRINISMLPQAKIGDYCLVHAGFAIGRIEPDKAKETLRLIDEIH